MVDFEKWYEKTRSKILYLMLNNVSLLHELKTHDTNTARALKTYDDQKRHLKVNLGRQPEVTWRQKHESEVRRSHVWRKGGHYIGFLLESHKVTNLFQFVGLGFGAADSSNHRLVVLQLLVMLTSDDFTRQDPIFERVNALIDKKDVPFSDKKINWGSYFIQSLKTNHIVRKWAICQTRKVHCAVR